MVATLKSLGVYSSLVLFLSIFLSSALAEPHRVVKNISVSSESLNGLAEEDGSGLYWEIMRAIFEPHGYALKPLIIPHARSRVWTATGKVDAMLGARHNETERLFFPFWHLGVNFISVMFHKDSTYGWQNEYSLRDQTIGMVRNAKYEQYLYVPIKLQEVAKRSDGVKMLSLKRIGFYLDKRLELESELFHRSAELEAFGFIRHDYVIKDLVSIKQYVAFSDTQRGRSMAELFDRGMERLIANGELKRLYDKYGHTTYPYP